MVLEKNNLTVQEWNKFYTELIVLYVHLKIAIFFDHSTLGLENKFFLDKDVKPSHPPTPRPLLFKFVVSLTTPLERLWRYNYNNWTSPKHNFMQHTIVLGWSQFKLAFLCLKRRPKWKKSGGIFCLSKKICDRQVYFTSKSWLQIRWWVNQSFKYVRFINVFVHKYWGKQYRACVPFLSYRNREQNLFFLALFKPIIL